MFLLVLTTGSECSGLQQTFVDLSAPGEILLHHGHSGTGQEEDPKPGEADGRGRCSQPDRTGGEAAHRYCYRSDNWFDVKAVT